MTIKDDFTIILGHSEEEPVGEMKLITMLLKKGEFVLPGGTQYHGRGLLREILKKI